MMKEENLAFPGDELAILEEFIPVSGVYSDENGKLRSTLIGKVVKDIINKNLKVIPFKKKYDFPRLKSVVIGYVNSVKSDIALITILYDGNLKPISAPLAGFLHVSQVDEEGKNISDYVLPGDLVKAKIISSENPFQLSFKHSSLGVILASCSKCGAIMQKLENGKLKCPKCGNIENRKLSSDYINLKDHSG
ncbi:exosome complex RNA-binding protein Csl4 [Fervidicoccus fontis]|uniref:Exosome complex component Csl4 n=2 Tax=Fervidicoccus fontis TaxID=683846 RepID=I0A281_FERFK|nr:exosome complex RNA-binding protein Csl4 [Fervidicoccus fontis]AFH43088.1 exosome complex RNA-binding protein Csl4 [Fervidicoccus fontis Kam940]MBE9391358.1 exosome complex RNA-binding protein Csl4 [Fervidicoccus fontis]PMB75620.1 MAG: 30S ribosomal protein S27ae [Fervidicoccus fontis]HEW64118.1 RNA-binding protein [Fervidicoccus fontis]